ncbi:MAG TPA: vWA domain-containing protein [Polyangiaceae bacterium]|nr:vWA domain-containing protein [Polyangiaceae bacterium]
MSTRFQLDSLLPSSRRCARLTWLLLLAACSSSEPGPSVDSDQTGGSQDSGDGDSHSGGDQGTGGALSQDRGAGGRTFPEVEFLYDPSKDVKPSTCAETTISAQPLPLDMFIVLDRTGSMGEDCTLQLDGPPQVDSMWCKAVSALAQYFTSAEAAGHRAALQFMIPAATQSTECGTASTNLHTQAEVDLTQLPEASNGPLILALEAQVPDATSTALESALNGIVVYTAAHQTQGREMIGILITDGDPSFCSDSLSTLSRIPREHFEDTGIRTFIMGMTGATASTLETMAAEAGAPEHSDYCDPADANETCHYWSVADGDPAAFVSALGAIQNTAVGCEFTVPDTDSGVVDLDTVQVAINDDSAPSIMLSPVDGTANCGSEHYTTSQRDGKPTVVLCPSTCERITDTKRLDITIECQGN